jgi:hypothetical protein
MQSDEQDKMARKLLMSVMPLGPKSAREALEMVKGGACSDEEWAKFGPPWARNWEECVDLYEIVEQAQDALAAAYEDYKKT